jgi:hypothetical protein
MARSRVLVTRVTRSVPAPTVFVVDDAVRAQARWSH